MTEAVTDPRELPDAPGVYLLTHRVTGDTYVGSSQSIRRRFRGHLTDLKRGRHCNRRMRDLVAAHGIDFECCPLQLTGKSPRFPHERTWFFKLKPTLNSEEPPVTTGTRSASQPKTPVQFKVDADVLGFLAWFRKNHPFHPSPSQVVNAALRQWIETSGADLLRVEGLKWPDSPAA